MAGDGLPVIDFSVDAAWNSGYTGKVSILNDEPQEINGWTLEFDLTADISSIWNARVVSSEGGHYTVRNATWNSRIAAGSCVALGFVAMGDAGNVPADYVFNGTAVGEPRLDPLLSIMRVACRRFSSIGIWDRIRCHAAVSPMPSLFINRCS